MSEYLKIFKVKDGDQNTNNKSMSLYSFLLTVGLYTITNITCKYI